MIKESLFAAGAAETIFDAVDQSQAKQGYLAARATLQLNWKTAAYSLRRLCSLKTCGIAAF